MLNNLSSYPLTQFNLFSEFSSFARQLNFYGFRKIQTRPLRNDDFDKSTAKWVTFHNENFKRGRPELLQKIQRSTRGGADKATLADQAREVDSLNAKVFILEEKVRDLETNMERNILGKVEAMVMNIVGSAGYSGFRMPPQNMFQHERSFGSIGFRAVPLLGAQAARAFSTASASSMGGATVNPPTGHAANTANSGTENSAEPTLPPHPKQKMLPPPPLGTMPNDPASGGIRNIGGDHLTNNSSLLLRNAWEDKFLSSVMMGDGASRAASLAGIVGGGLGGGLGNTNVGGLAALAAAQQMRNQQQQMEYAAMLQKNAQQEAVPATGTTNGGRGMGGATNDGGGANASKMKKDSDLQRQTTAEILLEAAGELGTNTGRENTVGRFLAAVDGNETKREEV